MKQPSTAKTKARDIIVGWPRSRSTSSPYADSHLPWWKVTGEPLVYDRQRHSDDCQNEEYHARQQDMLDEYVERYRRLTKHGECLLDPGYYIDIFGQRTRIYMNFRSFYRKE